MKGLKFIPFSGFDPGLEPYWNLILMSYAKSLKYGNPWFKEIDDKAFYTFQKRYFQSLRERPDAIFRLAVLQDDPDTCIAWSLSEKKTLHYVYVKGDIKARKLGIGTCLLPNEFDTVTHMTRTSRKILKKKYPKVIFNPFA